MKIRYRLTFLFILIPWILFAGSRFASTSVLSGGSWYKFSVRHNGIHRITYHDLVNMGIDPALINTANIRIYGNGSGMVPETNGAPRTDDLREISIQVNDGGDGKFDSTDFIMFYGESPDGWNLNQASGIYTHYKNLYSDVTYYYMTFDLGAGKRVVVQPMVSNPYSYLSSRWDDVDVHELDLVSVVKSGKRWFGEQFSKTKKHYDFDYSFPYIDSLTPLRMKISLAGRSDVQSKFILFRNGVRIDSLTIDPVTLDLQGDYARGVEKVKSLASPKPVFRISVEYNAPTDPSTGWLDYIELQMTRKLYWTGHEFSFRDLVSKAPGRITEFRMKKAVEGITIWDISDLSNISRLETTFADSLLTFRLRTDSLHTFFAFNSTSYDTVSFVGKVANQNLHALQPREMIIVSPPAFSAEAQRLADFHRIHNQIDAVVVSVPEIFNEFSCGQPDPGGIRDFMKMLFDRGGAGTRPQYLLLFGDGSYDPKDRTPGNDNFVPTLESQESLSTTASFVSDDFFGIMGNLKGYDATGTIDIGVGRFPVNTPAQSATLVDKIIHYSGNSDTLRADWRNNITLACDEGDRNYFVSNSEELAGIVAVKYPVINVDKIYFDAFPMVSIPAGYRFPEANKALNAAVARGTLIINYIGHGGETGWSARQVLSMADINSWTNSEKLPVFVTATCEFSRFDNPERFSAGEQIVVMPGGGGIAMFSTTRTTFAGSNQALDTSFFRHMMDRRDGRYIRMGELIMLSKNINLNNSYIRNFVLLGDPAQQMAFPEDDIITTNINSIPAGQQADTAFGLSKVNVQGKIQDYQGNFLQGFNGVLTAKVFDKPTVYSTLGNTYGQNNGSYPQKFLLQDHLMDRLKVPVTSGEFSFSFIVPKGVGLFFGKGKISYYAQNGVTDAKGYTNNLIFGGTDPGIIPEANGPSVRLFMDNRNFISGGKTAANPLLIADLYDTSGINSTGFGIGHDITGVLDDDWAHSVVLNDYFDPLSGSYTRGSINYQLSDLSSGQHKYTLRAFDLYDNSTEQDLYFWVQGESDLSVQNVFCYPNPAKTETNFSFIPVTSVGGFDVSIDIYNLSGIKLKSITSSYPESVVSPVTINWNLADGSGNKLFSGIYPFTVKFKGKNGAFVNTSGKLVIIH
ncbi:MAG: type IX secretion system sortase PorU [Bacteroidetes bacterium]|nr:type IX secretion system sortase PorU [Bacteroidota bacterium]